MEERDYWLWLTRISKFSNKKVRTVLSFGMSPYELFKAPASMIGTMLQQKPFKEEDLLRFLESRDEKALENYVKRMKALGIRFVCIEDIEYPEEFYGLYEPIFVLYYRGSFPDNRLSIAMVGARQCSAYGRKVAERFGEELAYHGVNVVSGMARGIDSHSHWGALRGNGFTTAVLGSGINCCYPKENLNLMKEIISKGCVMSEYGLDVMPSRITFPMRNRIISSLSQGVLLVEAKVKSGSLITVDYALEYGKDIFAIPGDVLGRSNEGSNNIIRNGAKPVFHAKDILEEYSFYSNNENVVESRSEIILEEKEKIVYSCISLIPVFIDEIAEKTGMTMNELQFMLTKLEIKGAVIQLPNKHYIRDH